MSAAPIPPTVRGPLIHQQRARRRAEKPVLDGGAPLHREKHRERRHRRSQQHLGCSVPGFDGHVLLDNLQVGPVVDKHAQAQRVE